MITTLVNPNHKLNWNIGDTAYFYDPVTGMIKKGTVRETISKEEIFVGPSVPGTMLPMQKTVDQLFYDEKKAYDALERTIEKQTMEYSDEVRTTEDLLRFALDHDLKVHVYKQPERQAFIQKAKELLGVDLEPDART